MSQTGILFGCTVLLVLSTMILTPSIVEPMEGGHPSVSVYTNHTFPIFNGKESRLSECAYCLSVSPANRELTAPPLQLNNASLGPGYVQSTLCLMTNVLVSGKGGSCSGSNGGVAIDPAARLAIVAGPNDSVSSPAYQLTFVNLSTERVVKSVPLPRNASLPEAPWGPVYDSLDGDVYVPVQSVDQNVNISIVNITSGNFVGKIAFGQPCVDFLFDAATNEFYLIQGGDVVVLNGTTYSQVAVVNIPLPGGYVLFPGVIDSQNGVLYIPNANYLAMMGTANHTYLGSILLGARPTIESNGAAFDSANGFIYVSEGGNNSIGVVSARNNTLIQTIKTGGTPSSSVYDPGNGLTYIYAGSATTLVMGGSTPTVIGTESVAGGMEVGPNIPNLYVASGGDLYDVAPPSYTLIINETGLPTGTPWNVTIGGTSKSSTTPSITFNELNGSYAYTVSNVAGYAETPSAGVTNVSGSPIVISVNFTPIPSLQSVSLTPSTLTTQTSNSTTFSAVPICSNAACPGNISLIWSLNNTLGRLSTSTSLSTVFSAGGSPGNLTLTVNASLSGRHALAVSYIMIVSPPVIPTLQSVLANPASDTMQTGASASFTAEPICQSRACPSNLSYSWSVNNSLGSLAATTQSTAEFKAGSLAGEVMLTVRATLDGVSKTGSSLVTIVSSPVPILSRVAVSPLNDTLYLGDSAIFTATPSCSGGPCPSGIAYKWTLNRSLGQINATFGSTVHFIAGTSPGNVTLSVIADLNGGTPQLADAGIQVSRFPVPVLSSVNLSPSSVSIQSQTSVVLSAMIQCSGGNACPPGTVYAWHLADPALGDLNSSTGSKVSFLAGFVAGTEKVSVTVTLNGVSENASALVQIVTKNPALGGGLFSLTGWQGYLVTGIIAVVAVISVVLFILKRRRTRSENSLDVSKDKAGETK